MNSAAYVRVVTDTGLVMVLASRMNSTTATSDGETEAPRCGDRASWRAPGQCRRVLPHPEGCPEVSVPSARCSPLPAYSFSKRVRTSVSVSATSSGRSNGGTVSVTALSPSISGSRSSVT